MGQIKLNQVSKSFGETRVIPPLDLTIEDGEFTVFVGPSGCGKSTLLRLIAGLEDITSGHIEIDGQDATNVPPAKRGLAMVFQSYALYPHMSVRKNIAFPMKMAGVPEDEQRRRIAGAAKALNLTDYLDRRPGQLSGGQRQRVAIGRAIVREPAAFLFDEPLSNLDAALRVGMRLEISELHGVLYPIYLICIELGILDSRIALVIILMLMNLPIIVWMLYTYFREIPGEILEAARMDGATLKEEILYVLTPMAIPGIASTLLLNFILAWNEAFWTLNLTAANAAPLTAFIASYSSPEGLFFAKLSAASTMAIAPILILGWFSQKQLVSGLTFGAVK